MTKNKEEHKHTIVRIEESIRVDTSRPTKVRKATITYERCETCNYKVAVDMKTEKDI